MVNEPGAAHAHQVASTTINSPYMHLIPCLLIFLPELPKNSCLQLCKAMSSNKLPLLEPINVKNNPFLTPPFPCPPIDDL